jgi:hypothetical protein
MKRAERRRFEELERRLVSSSLYARDPRSDAELTETLKDHTAIPSDLQQVYDICAPDLEIRLFQEGTTRRMNPDYGRDRTIIGRFDMAAELLRYPADVESGITLEWQPFEPDIWVASEGRRSSHSRPLMPFVFVKWTHSYLVEQLVDHDPMALASIIRPSFGATTPTWSNEVESR